MFQQASRQRGRRPRPVLPALLSAGQVLLLVLLSIPACGIRWHELPDPYSTSELPSPIRITLDSGEQIVLYEPEIKGGQVVGDAEHQYDSVKPPRRSYSIAAVVRIEYGDPSPAQRAGQGAAIGLMTTAFVLVLFGILLGRGWGDD